MTRRMAQISDSNATSTRVVTVHCEKEPQLTACLGLLHSSKLCFTNSTMEQLHGKTCGFWSTSLVAPHDQAEGRLWTFSWWVCSNLGQGPKVDLSGLRRHRNTWQNISIMVWFGALAEVILICDQIHWKVYLVRFPYICIHDVHRHKRDKSDLWSVCRHAVSYVWLRS